MKENQVKCPHCGISVVSPRSLSTHLRSNKQCMELRKVNDLCERGFVLCHVESPIYSWVSTYMKDDPIWEFDLKDEPWVPSWFAEAWFRAEKSVATGRLVCHTQAFLDSVLLLMKNEKRRGALATQARLRDVGYFGRLGGIYCSDCKTPLWQPVQGKVEQRNGELTKSDYLRTAQTMMTSHNPFTGTRYR